MTNIKMYLLYNERLPAEIAFLRTTMTSTLCLRLTEPLICLFVSIDLHVFCGLILNGKIWHWIRYGPRQRGIATYFIRSSRCEYIKREVSAAPQECGCACRAVPKEIERKIIPPLEVGKLFDPSGRWLSGAVYRFYCV